MHVCVKLELSYSIVIQLVLFRIKPRGTQFCVQIQHLATRMAAHGTLRDFDLTKVSVEDFHERLEFYYLVNNIEGEGGG